jgi:predicted small secreted protein
MLRINHIWRLLLVACLLLAGCNSTNVTGDPVQVVRDNIAAANSENIDAYMATIHPKSPYYASTRDALTEAFQLFDLKYELSNLSLVSVNNTEAQVNFVLTTRRIAGPEFTNNRVTGIFNLQPQDGKWLIYDQSVSNIEDLP